MLSRLPVNLLAPIVVAIPVLLLGAWLSLMWRDVSRDAVAQLAQQNIQQLHDLAEVEINEMLALPERMSLINRQMIESGRLDTDSLPSWRRTMLRQLQSFDMLSAVTWGSEDGRSAWVARYADGSYRWDLKDDPSQPYMYEWLIDDDGIITEEPSLRFRYDLFSRPWYVEPRRRGQPVWSPPYVWAGATDNIQPTLGMSFGVPLRNPDGSFRGVISTDISLQDLSSFLETLEIGENGISLIVDEQGQLLAASQAALAIPRDTELRLVGSSDDARVGTAGRLLESPERLDAPVTVELIDGIRHYFQLTPIRTGRGLNWNLATIVPESEFLATIDREFRRSTLASIAVMLLAVLLGTLAANWLMKPVQLLVRRVRQIATGDLKTVTVPAQAPEYMHLGEALNDLCTNLDRSHRQEVLLQRELDHRVKNILAQIVSLSRQTARRSTVDRPLVEELVGQVTSLSSVHELLGRKGQTGLPMQEMVEECCGPYLTAPEQLDVEGPALFVEPKAAMALALVCNELATNACKYGALTAPDGRITIRWRLESTDDSAPRLTWSWRERGGPPPPEKVVESFGLMLLQAMIPFELDGDIDLQLPETGLRYDARIPVDFFTPIEPT